MKVIKVFASTSTSTSASTPASAPAPAAAAAAAAATAAAAAVTSKTLENSATSQTSAPSLLLSFLFAVVLIFSSGWVKHASASTPYFVAESSRPYQSLAFEFQAYPTGIIPGFTYERFISSVSAVHVRLGVQAIRHQDFGEHDDERGNGFGGTLGYRRYWPSGFSVGARVDLWSNRLDWKDNIGEPNERRGETTVLVLQPVVEVSIRKFFTSDWFVQPSAALGAEINIATDGEDTGEGFIYLGALTLGRTF